MYMHESRQGRVLLCYYSVLLNDSFYFIVRHDSGELIAHPFSICNSSGGWFSYFCNKEIKSLCILLPHPVIDLQLLLPDYFDPTTIFFMVRNEGVIIDV